ncbi:MAG: peptidoglycan-associated lipoprotein Pal [Nitrospiraceae bacterium]|nr:peptidoglycan-associated lipoprotein Pal [Nitrospiraceae bacterium]
MKMTHWFLMMIAGLGLVVLAGCPKKTEVSSTPEAQKVAAAPAPAAAEGAKSSEPTAARKAEEEQAKEAAARANAGLQAVYFDYDRATIREDAKAAMKANAEYLKANPKMKISIEGNCDDRGTIEYNQALGQRRSSSAKKYLTAMGITAKRISLVSYGKEKPACTEDTDACWQKNRRDDFVAQ